MNIQLVFIQEMFFKFPSIAQLVQNFRNLANPRLF